MNLTGPIEVGIAVADADRMVRFYTDIGFEVQARIPLPAAFTGQIGLRAADIELINLTLGGAATVKLLAGAPEGQPAPGDVVGARPGLAYVTLLVRDIDGVVDRLLGAGATAAADPPAGQPGSYPRFGYFRDPEGNVLELIDTGDGGRVEA